MGRGHRPDYGRLGDSTVEGRSHNLVKSAMAFRRRGRRISAESQVLTAPTAPAAPANSAAPAELVGQPAA